MIYKSKSLVAGRWTTGADSPTEFTCRSNWPSIVQLLREATMNPRNSTSRSTCTLP